MVHGLYENIETNDAFLKEVTRLMHSLLSDLQAGNLDPVHQQKVLDTWKLYLQKIELQGYFQQIAHSTLKVLLTE